MGHNGSQRVTTGHKVVKLQRPCGSGRATTRLKVVNSHRPSAQRVCPGCVSNFFSPPPPAPGQVTTGHKVVKLQRPCASGRVTTGHKVVKLRRPCGSGRATTGHKEANSHPPRAKRVCPGCVSNFCLRRLQKRDRSLRLTKW